MSKARETKAIASRIDIQYHAQPHWFRWWRRVMVLLALLGTGAWAAYVLAGRNERVLNPGRLAVAHAMLDNNCAACHDHAGKGGFLKTVSDSACLACHTATASHHPLADLNPSQPSRAHLTSLTHPKMAADCAACHVEHRSHALLKGTDDRLCVQCHGDLNSHVTEGSKLDARLANVVTSFAPNHHPEFGRTLPAPTTQALATAAKPVTPWADQTKLKFNHGKHLDPNGAIKIQGCASCHRTDAPSGAVPPAGAASPGQAWKSGTAEVAATSRRYMQPVNYERDCRSCHSVGLPATKDLDKFFATKVAPLVSHDSLDIVRAQLADLDRLYMSLLEDHPKLLKSGESADEWLAAQREALLETLKKGKKFGEPLEESLDAVQKADEARESLKKELAKKPIDPAKVKEIIEQMSPADSPQPPTEKAKMLLAAAAEYQVAILNSSSSCEKCHETQGKVMPASEYQESLGTPKSARLRTLPTGLSSSPRRWFANSEFSHDAHGGLPNLTCLNCHQGMDRDGLGKHEDDGIARMPAMQTCITCHFPDRSDQRGAGASCNTCHNFHDRKQR